MAKYRAPKGKSSTPAPRQGVPCLILMVVGMVLFLVLMYLGLKSS
jgi:hypothetical protein